MDRRKFLKSVTGSAALSPGAAAAQRASAGKRSASSGGNRRRVLILAVDGMDPALVARWKNDLPHLARIESEGYSGRILPYVSCWGNIDFMSMMTGAPPGTQYGSREVSGQAPGHRNCVAETLWHVLDSEKRRSFLLDFPGARSSPFTATLPAPGKSYRLAPGAAYQTPDVQIPGLFQEGLETTGWPPGGGPKPGRRPVVIETPKPARGWNQLPDSERPVLETRLEGPGSVSWPALVLASDTSYDTLAIYESKGGIEATHIRESKWSPWVQTQLQEQDAAVRFRLLDLSPDGKSLQVLQSSVCVTQAFSEPPELSRHLVEKLGPYWKGSAIPPTPNDPFWEVGEEEALEGAFWVAQAAPASLEWWDWELFVHKLSLVDTALHQNLTLADPSYYRYDPRIAAAHDAVYRHSYIDLDKMIGRLIEALGKRGDTALIIASDHGGGVNNTVCDIDERLRERGLLARSGREIDWSATKAYTKRSRQGTEIFVNLKGRELHGAVESADFEKVQEEVIDALLDWRDPQTNRRAVAYALKLRDAALIGYWGPEAGDVQFAYNPGFVWGVNPGGAAIAPSRSPIANHGPQIVTAETEYSSMMGYLAAWGPGVARGVRRDESLEGPISIDAVAPSVAALLGCRTPRQCRLGPIRGMLA